MDWVPLPQGRDKYQDLVDTVTSRWESVGVYWLAEDVTVSQEGLCSMRVVSYGVNTKVQILCDFDRASSLICGNKMPTRCNRDFYCRSYCLLNMFRAPLCPSSGAQEYYTAVAACGISCCGFQVAGLVWSWGLCFRFVGCAASCKPDT